MITVNFLIGGMNFREVFGISRYQLEIHKRLEGKVKIIEVGYKKRNLKLKKFNNIIRFYEYYLKYPLIIKRACEEGVYHIPHTLYAYLSRFLDSEKTVATCFDIEPSIMFNSITNSLFWTLNLLGLKRCKYIVTISEYSKREIMRFLGFDFPENRIKVIYEGIDLDKFKRYDDQMVESFKKEVLGSFKISENSKILLFVGSEQPRKNLRRVIEALYLLKKKYNMNAKLIKIGRAVEEGEREKNLKLVKELGLQGEVYFLDYVEDVKLPLYYNIADCLVLPTLFEGAFALPILEAFGCRTPVLASNIAPILEVTQGTGALMVDPYNANEIAKGIYEILIDSELREEKIEEGYEIAKSYTWNRSAEEFYKIYKELARL